MKLYKKIVPQLILLGFICAVALFSYINHEFISVGNNTDTNNTIIIDAGHGGFDGGAVAGDGTVEKDINLSIANKTAAMLRFYGFNVIMTRTTDTGTESDQTNTIPRRKKSDLQNRLQLMKDNPDAIYVSIHLNKFTTSSASGAQVFYTKNYIEAATLANCIQNTITALIQPQNTRVVKQGSDSTYLLKNATVPAVIVECGFLSNRQELEKLKTDDYQSQMAFAVTTGIIEFLK
ncbi:MAG: N-acetylmuramoyl-L-alanine amidase [Clostridia bacterium]|nr:N-acetylmuramoyl-L-alanine amidase [Clostridia bacterium]